MEDVGIPELTPEQMEELCEIAEETARKYILSKVPKRRLSSFNITINTQGSKPITITIDVEVTLSPIMKDYNVRELTDQTTKKTFASIEEYLREKSWKP